MKPVFAAGLVLLLLARCSAASCAAPTANSTCFYKGRTDKGTRVANISCGSAGSAAACAKQCCDACSSNTGCTAWTVWGALAPKSSAPFCYLTAFKAPSLVGPAPVANSCFSGLDFPPPAPTPAPLPPPPGAKNVLLVSSQCHHLICLSDLMFCVCLFRWLWTTCARR